MSGRGRPPVSAGRGRVRIVGGRWRNTRLQVPDLPGLRPTSDRVRETLFNWLMPALPGARVLDLFAGSGALGLEAVSRGAASALLVERDPALAAALRAVVERLGAREQVQVVGGDALRWLQSAPPAHADIVFVDPPFADGLWMPVIQQLARHVSNGAWLYVEAPAPLRQQLPSQWVLQREGGTREVGYALYRHAAATLHEDLNTVNSA